MPVVLGALARVSVWTLPVIKFLISVAIVTAIIGGLLWFVVFVLMPIDPY